MMTPPKSLAVVGAGFTGLVAAFYAKRSQPDLDVTIFEASDRCGGVVQTIHRDGFLIEQSADSFLATPDLPWARQLVSDLGLEHDLMSTNPRSRRALVLFNQRLYPVPVGFNLVATSRIGPVLCSRLLSWRGKLRLLGESRVPPRPEAVKEESLKEFAVRRVGKEAFERLVQPLSAGIYAADPEKLSMDAALPKFVAMEHQFGSISSALKHQNRGDAAVSGARYSKFVTLRNGLSQLVEALVTRLKSQGVTFSFRMPIDKLDREPQGRWRLSAGLKSHHTDAVIIAAPPRPGARLLGPSCTEVAEVLSEIRSTTLAIVCVAYQTNQVQRWPMASGFVVPTIESRELIAVSFASCKFAGRAPSGKALFRVFLGGANNPGILERSDDQLCEIAHRQLQSILNIQGSPLFTTCARWQDASPQYHLGHTHRVRKIFDAADRVSNVAIAGNSFNGVGLPQCVKSALDAVQRVVHPPA